MRITNITLLLFRLTAVYLGPTQLAEGNIEQHIGLEDYYQFNLNFAIILFCTNCYVIVL